LGGRRNKKNQVRGKNRGGGGGGVFYAGSGWWADGAQTSTNLPQFAMHVEKMPALKVQRKKQIRGTGGEGKERGKSVKISE